MTYFCNHLGNVGVANENLWIRSEEKEENTCLQKHNVRNTMQCSSWGVFGLPLEMSGSTKIGQNAKCNQVSLENCKIIWATLGGCCQ